MLRLNLGRVVVLYLAFISTSMVWCEDGANPGATTNVANALELELIKKEAVLREKWKSQGTVTKSEVIGSFKYWPFDNDRKSFVFNADGTGEVYGGVRGTGTWKMMWDFDERQQMIMFQTLQFKRIYTAIKKDGKVWLIDGRELWRQGINHNQRLPSPIAKAQKSD